MSFKNLSLHPKIVEAVEAAGYTTPTPIQEQAIPVILEGSDLRASAETGTGKTAAFLLPALCKLTTPASGRGPRILILVPTRELAMQVATQAVKYSKCLPGVKTVCIYGGAPYPPQCKDLSRPYDILVATPGRLIDHMQRGRIDFSRIELFILDEADRMLDMGFIEPVEEIAAALHKDRQTLMFSATFKGSVLQLSNRLLKQPKEVSIASNHVKHDQIEQKLHHVDNLDHKYRLLNHLLADPTLKQAIVFTSTKFQADLLVEQLQKEGKQASALHGDMNQRQRSRTLLNLRQGKIDILVATDVAARGIDVQSITHVFNFDLPRSPEDYVHRIGRTGRAGAKGVALSFATYKETSLVRRIEQFTGQKLPTHTVPGMEPSGKQQGAPADRRRDKKGFNPKRKFKSRRAFSR